MEDRREHYNGQAGQPIMWWYIQSARSHFLTTQSGLVRRLWMLLLYLKAVGGNPECFKETSLR